MLWRKVPPDLQLSPDHIDIWCTRLDLPKQQIGVFADTLSSEELERAGKFAFPDKYREYVVTRGLLRHCLALITGIEPGDFQFAYTKHNKPYLNENKISFNVSHSHDYVLVALGLNRNIGVDVEKIRKNVEYEKLAKRFFSTFEYISLMKAAEQDRERVFYAIWTRKEAFVKAIGKGIAFGLSEFDVSTQPDKPAVLLKTRWDPDAVLQWNMTNISMEENYMAALVSDGAGFELRCWTL